MKKEIIEITQYRMKRSHSTFQEGITLLESASYNGALNRFYYAAFYAVRALLATKEVDSSKHSGVISLFHQHFVKGGVFPKETAKTLSISFEERQDSDYEDFTSPSSEEVESIRDQVRQFIDQCEKTLHMEISK